MMSILSRLSVGQAFISSASRMVGSSYRIYDAYDPKLREQGVTPAPELVVRREGISLALAWTFGLFTPLVTEKMEKRLKIPGKVGTFINIVMSNILAEGVSRLIAYSRAKISPAAPPPGKERRFNFSPPKVSGPMAFPSAFGFRYPGPNANPT